MQLYDLRRRLKEGPFVRHCNEPPPIRQQEPEPELKADLRRVHEAAHIIVGHIGGLYIEDACSMRGDAHVNFQVPEGVDGAIAYMVTLAASGAAQRKYGATGGHYERHCFDDDLKIRKMASQLAASDRDIDRIIDVVNREATRLVARYWRDIEFIATALRRLGDHLDEDEIQRLLAEVGKAPSSPARQTRAATPPLEVETMDGRPYLRRFGYLKAA